ncbi:MAG: adenine deaminase [Desulfobacterales bacterium]|jgi:adenine deaminase
MELKELIKAAHGEIRADLLLTNARRVDVFSGCIMPSNIAITNGYITGFNARSAKKIVDVRDCWVAPGFIDAHVHIESSMMGVTEFVRTVVPLGTTTVVADPHEIANVLGTDGIRYMLASSENQPMNIYYTLPSCVPATEMETSGARLNAEDLQHFMNHERILALAEMMNFPGVIHTDPQVLLKIETANRAKKPIDGHAPGLTGADLTAYVAAGISSDHECTSVKEAREKLAAGMHIMIREGTGAKNLNDLLPVINKRTCRRMMWCTDDRHPHDLVAEGHIDFMVRSAVRKGLDPIIAIQMATLNPAEYFGIRDVGAIAPGKKADLVVISDLAELKIEQVYCHGQRVAENGRIAADLTRPQPAPVPPSMYILRGGLDMSIPAESDRIRVIEIVPDQLITHEKVLKASVVDNMAVADPSGDVLKIAVVDRHTASGNVAKGFVKGLGLKHGALASSVAHDSHNIIVVGANDTDMRAAVKAVADMQGGLVAVSNNEIRARLPLPIAGLMSHEPATVIRDKLDCLVQVARELGSTLNDPFMTLSFLALPVIPELKITDLGLVNVDQFKFVPLFV